MIRPVTCVCLLLAAGSGLYLYQAKHQAQLLDREITRTMTEVDRLRQRINVLRADYQLEQDPETLGELTQQYLEDLKPTAPGQFTTWAELEKRLPSIPPPPVPEAAPPPPVPVAAVPDDVPVARAEPPQPAVAPDRAAARAADGDAADRAARRSNRLGAADPARVAAGRPRPARRHPPDARARAGVRRRRRGARSPAGVARPSFARPWVVRPSSHRGSASVAGLRCRAPEPHRSAGGLRP